MELQKIQLKDFYKIEAPRRIIVHDCPQQFARLDLKHPLGSYAISWRSGSAIQPIIHLSKSAHKLWVGVDQKIAAIDLENGYLCLSLTLSSHLFQILSLSDRVAVLAELEVLLFNAGDCSIQAIKQLPDIAADMLFVDSNLMIRLLDDRHFILNLQTYELKEAVMSK